MVALTSMLSGETYECCLHNYEKLAPDLFKDGELQTGIGQALMLKLLTQWGLKPVQLDNFYTCLSGILAVPSLNLEGKLHVVYWDAPSQSVLDPQEGREGKKIWTSDLMLNEHKSFGSFIVDFNKDKKTTADILVNEINERLQILQGSYR